MYQAFGGADGIRTLTDRFYDLMELEPQYQALRQMHGEDMTLIREKLYEFFSGWLGGPQLFVEKYGHPQLRSRHMPFAVNVQVRNEWIACFAQAMSELDIDKALAEPVLIQVLPWQIGVVTKTKTVSNRLYRQWRLTHGCAHRNCSRF